jgi:HK97 family phage portal protein
LSSLEAAAVAVDTHNAAAKWNKALLDNAARPSGALVYSGPEGAVLSDNQFERLKRELEDQYQGSVNAGRPLLLEGGLDWKAMSLTPKDMDFLEAKHAAAREIALAFGVPPMLLGIPGDNTYANFQEANRVFWRQTVLPLASRIGTSIAQWLAPQFGDGLRLVIDTDKIDALAVDRTALWDRLTNAPFLTLNEKREAIGYAPVPGGDRLG